MCFLPANVIRFRKKSTPIVWLYTFPKLSWEKREAIEVCETAHESDIIQIQRRGNYNYGKVTVIHMLQHLLMLSSYSTEVSNNLLSKKGSRILSAYLEVRLWRESHSLPTE